MAKAKKPGDLTPLELEMMKILWEDGPATVQAVHQRIQSIRPLAYNTVQTVLAILYRKGKVKRKIEQRAYVYSPSMTREKTAANTLKDIVQRLFGGRPEALVLSMVKSRQLSAGQLAELQKLVQEGGSDESTD